MKKPLRLLKSFWVLLTLSWLACLLACWLLGGVSPRLREHLPEAAAIVSAVFLLVIVLRQYRRIHTERNLEHLLQVEADRSHHANVGFRDRQVLHERLKHAIAMLRTDCTAGGGGKAALSDLPWYLLIGEAGAGKTTLLARSGLCASNATADADDDGTRHCDFHLCADAVLIDTAARYLHEEQSASEFRAFLSMLRKQRGKAAINGLVMVVDLADLLLASRDERHAMAIRLRTLLEGYATCLGSRPPVYLMLNKLDRLPGFSEAFADMGPSERQQPLGMTFGLGELRRKGLEAVFATRMDNLQRHIRQQVDIQLSRAGAHAGSTLVNFPRYFSELGGVLQEFVQHLAPEQQRTPPLLRGLYFTSATQDHQHLRRVYEDKVIREFSLVTGDGEEQAQEGTNNIERCSYFITDVFRRVIFPDRDLVLHLLRQGHRTGVGPLLLTSASLAAVALVGWQTLSFGNNREWLGEVREQLASSQDLEPLRKQMDTVDAYRRNGVPLALGAGLYQGEAIHALTRSVYLGQLRSRVLEPVTRDLQVQLRQFNSFASSIQASAVASAMVSQPVRKQATDTGLALTDEMLERLDAKQVESIVEAYHRLKLYLLLSEPQAGETTDFIAANLPGPWPSLEDDSLIERNLAVYLHLLETSQAPALPRNQALIDETRDNLKRFMIASSLVDREYLRLQLESSQRFPVLTLDDLVDEPGRMLLRGSLSVPAIYTRQGWETFVKPELLKLVSSDLHTDSDWVLDGDDNHAIVQKANFVREFMNRYKRDYALAWYRLADSVGVRPFSDLPTATRQLGLLSDIQNSPIKRLLMAIDANTRWDLPRQHALPSPGDLPAQGFWSKVSNLLDNADRLPAHVAAPLPAVEDGSLAKGFEPVARLFASHEGEGADSTLMDRYLAALRKLKVRLHNVQRAQDVGKSSKLLISETLDGQPNEVTALRNYVEGSIDTSQDALSRSLLRLFELPLQHAWETLRTPAGQQIAKAWTQQIARPWEQVMAHRYPIAGGSRNEASVKDLQRFIDPDHGLLPTFKRNEIGNLAGGEGLGPGSAKATLVRPQMLSSIDQASTLGQVIASLSDRDNGFEIMLEPSGRFTDILFSLDGQEQHYRNGRSNWRRFTWPGDGRAPGARLDVVTLDGTRTRVFDFPGRWGLLRLNESAQVEDLDGIQQRFSWNTSHGRVSLLVRNFGGVKLTDLGQVKALRALNESGGAR